MGISAETTTRAFREEYMEAFLERPRIELRPNRRVYIAIDPSGGGASAYAIVSLVKDQMGTVSVSAFLLRTPFSFPRLALCYHNVSVGTLIELECSVWRSTAGSDGSLGHSRCKHEAMPTNMSGRCAKLSM